MHPITRASLVIFCALFVACGDKGGDSGATDDGGDADGDGFAVPEDCNDSDASVHPGADDAWYDGVDSDCAQNNDFDADGDTVPSNAHGGGDCDDSDGSVYPTAVEIWYDGIDQDCGGDDDNDADVDGFAASVSGGVDCDDNNSSTYPGAVDTWYDGVDSNCDGRSDYDADLDGYDALDAGVGDDCDDGDDEVYPDAVEVWYDGVDSDCAGDDDYDSDLDGFPSDEFGGTDCDDADPETWYGATEKLDGGDTDCNGTADHFLVEAEYGGLAIIGADLSGMAGGQIDVGDIDGDGLSDLVMSQSVDYASDSGDGAVRYFAGASLTGSTVTSLADETIMAGVDTGPATVVRLLSDLDTDGDGELAIGGADAMTGAGTTPGAVFIFTSAELAVSSGDDFSDAGRRIWGANDGDRFGAEVRSITDMDGDGLAELVIGGPSAGSGGIAYLMLSGDLSAPGVKSAADAEAVWVGDEDAEAGAAIIDLGDFDGDGLGDALVGAPGAGSGAVYLMAGSTAPSSGLLTNLATAVLLGDNDGDSAGAALSAGDLDGDGDTDVVVGAPRQVTQVGRVHVVSGPDFTGTRALADAAFVNYTGTTVFGNAGASVASGSDVDGDGLDDLFIGGPGDSDGGGGSGAAWLVISGLSGNRALANSDASFTGGGQDDAAGVSVGLGDFNGDGLGDVVFGVPGEDNLGDEGATYIGFSGY